MHNNLNVFKSFLLIELDNLVEAIQQLITACKEKYKKHAVSHPVLLENTAFFQKEIWGITSFHQHIKDYNTSDIKNEDDMAKILKVLFADWVQSHDLPPALIPLVELKIDKVLRYIRQEQDSSAK